LIEAYLDSSVVMRIVLEQPNTLQEWSSIDLGVSSDLVRVECFRAIERLWRHHDLDDVEFEQKRAEVATLLRNVRLIKIDARSVGRAADPFPTYVATLDAIHLATAVAYRRTQPEDERPILFATHDKQLAKAAAAMHFEVIGVAA
jgi:predicted nucleic acid-binding protein